MSHEDILTELEVTGSFSNFTQALCSSLLKYEYLVKWLEVKLAQAADDKRTCRRQQNKSA
jgi:hypothetical protein